MRPLPEGWRPTSRFRDARRRGGKAARALTRLSGDEERKASNEAATAIAASTATSEMPTGLRTCCRCTTRTLSLARRHPPQAFPLPSLPCKASAVGCSSSRSPRYPLGGLIPDLPCLLLAASRRGLPLRRVPTERRFRCSRRAFLGRGTGGRQHLHGLRSSGNPRRTWPRATRGRRSDGLTLARRHPSASMRLRRPRRAKQP